MRRLAYWIPAALFIAGLAVLLPKARRKSADPPARQTSRQDESREPSAEATSGPKGVTLTEAEQARIGVRVATMKAAAARKRIRVPALVLSARSLAGARNAYVAAQANLAKARVNLGVAQKEYARLKKLYQDDQNVSQKDFQAAQGALSLDRIAVRTAHRQLALQASLVRQNWGDAVTGWVEKPSPTLDRVLAQNRVLVEVSLADGEPAPAPVNIWLVLPGGKERRARYVSPLPRVDPRVQGVSLLYLAAASPGLAPGATLTAELPVGRRMRGVVVPASAIIWSGGGAWAYVETAPGHFTRRPVATGFPLGGGYFAVRGFSPGEKIVVSGAQILLSAEFSPPVSSKGESDDDD